MLNSNSNLAAAYAECHRLARQHYENFPVASRLVPRDRRDALAAIYAFARCADDFADEYRPGETGAAAAPRLKLLAGWWRELEACYAGTAKHAVFIALADAVRKFDLSQEHFQNLLLAFESDVVVNRHETFSSLLGYCSHSANPVGRLVLEVFTPMNRREPILFELSDNICSALQLTNFWQDVRIDLERDRSYLPEEDLRRFNLALETVKGFLTPAPEAIDERWSSFLAFEVARTRELYWRGSRLPELVAPELRLQLRLTWLGGMRILSKIEAVHYDVFWRRPTLSRTDFLKLYFRARRRTRLDKIEVSARGSHHSPMSLRTPRERLTNQQTTNFYYSFVFLPREKREALEAVYAFARRGDDIVDGDLSPADATLEMKRYREALDACYAGPLAGNNREAVQLENDASLRTLEEAVQRYKISRQHFDDLILGLEMDLGMEGGAIRYETFAELATYCYRVAGTIGLIAIEIFGYRNQRTLEYAVNLGQALQLVNILRDVQSDARRGRIYLPREDLERFGVRPESLGEGRYDSSFVELMQFECDRARHAFDTARAQLAKEDRRSMRVAEIMAAIYWRLLKRMQARAYNVFGERIRLSRLEKFWTALSVYGGVEWHK